MALTKVFKITLQGARETEASALKIAEAYKKMAEEVRASKVELAKQTSVGAEAAIIVDLTGKLRQQEVQLSQLNEEKKIAEAQSLSQARAEKLLAEARANDAKAAKLQADAEKARTQSQIAQEKEIDRQIALDEKRAKQLEREKQLADALPGSYNAIRKALAELRPFVQNGNTGAIVKFQGMNLSFDEAIEKFKELSFAEQDFRRQFQKDGALVGEYSQSIVRAFEKLKIGDIIKDDLNGGKQAIKDLEAETQKLVVAYRQAQQEGSADLNRLQKEIRDNVVETENLRKAVLAADAQLRGMGGIGGQITSGIKDSFRNLKGEIAQFTLSYIGFQAAYSGVQKTFSETVKLDSLESSLQVVSKTSEELAVNQNFLRQTTDQLGLELTSTSNAFKSFYAASTSAGIGAEETRKIFFSASNAAANLKLSQEDANGVLLAFSQIASKGTVQAEELRGQIGERIPGAFSIAAKAMGVTQQELNKMLEGGKVLSAEFLPKFAAELQKTFGTDSQKKIEGLQASVNRLKNEFTETLADNKELLAGIFSTVLQFGSALLGILSYLPQIAALLGVMALGWAANNVQLVIQNAQLLLYNALIIRNYIALGVLSAAQLAYNTVLLVFNTGLRVVSASLRFFGVSATVASGPLGVLLAAVGLLGAALLGFSRAMGRTAADMKKQADQARILNEVTKEANRSISSQIGIINSWMSVVKSSAASADTKKKAVEELIKIDKAFSSVLKDNIIDLNELDKVYKKVTDSIILNARAQASAKLTAEKEQKVNELATVRQRLETEFASGKGLTRTIKGLTETEIDILNQSDLEGGTSLRANGSTAVFFEDDFKKIIGVLEKKEEAARNEYLKYLQVKQKADEELKDFIGDVNAQDAKKFEVDIAALRARIEALDKEIGAFQGAKKDLDAKVKEKEDLQKQLDALLGKNKTSTTGASKLSGETKDKFANIDAEKKRLTALLETAKLEQSEFNSKLIDSESIYLTELLKINNDAVDKKLAVIKAGNAKERETIEDLKLQRVQNIKQTNQQLFEIENKELERRLNAQNRNAQATLDLVNLNPNLNNTERVQAQEVYYNALLKNQIVFNEEQRRLEEKKGIVSKENEEKRIAAIEEIQKKLSSINLERGKAEIEDIRKQGEIQTKQHSVFYAQLRQKILDDITLTDKKKKKLIEELNKAERRTILSDEIITLSAEVKKQKELLDQGLINYEDYLEALDKLERKKNEKGEADNDKPVTKDFNLPSGSSTQKFLQEQLISSLGFDKESLEGQLLGEVIAQSFTLAQEAMNAYFDAQRQRIEEEKQIQIDRLDREEKRRLATAQSAAEEETIQRQYDQKRRNAEREAAQRLKKVKTAEAKIALSTELANIAVAAAANPANGPTFGAAGIIMYGALATLALARYGMRVAEINRQQFARGGKVQPVPLENGLIRTRSNIATQPNGDNVLATVRTGEVILNEDQQRRLGGAATFRKLGVPGFADGGLVGPQPMWANVHRVQAPIMNPMQYTPPSQNTQQSEDIQELKGMIKDIAAMVYASDAKEVQLNPNKVTEYQNKAVKDARINTL